MIAYPRAAARRRSLMGLTSIAALMTAFAANDAGAQTTSFNAGTPVVNSGAVTFDRGVTTPGTEVYTVNSRTAVLTFTPNDTAIAPGAPINFQNSGTTVRYTNGANTPAFTVLNRIVPTDASRPVEFNGRVISEIRAGQTVSPGGDVWFYSPGGIILGSTAAFDVGSLLLTARDPTNGTGVIGATNVFRGGGAAGSRIELRQGATINATAEGSYVAMMAPLVQQSGNVRVNGSAAYVAAEDAQITINANNLFDISVTTGTDTGNGFPINHSGSTGGPASSGAADPHRVYMVAVPKNTAITLLLGQTSRVGFDVATAAGVENGRVVLSSGAMSFPGFLAVQNGELGQVTGLFTGQTQAWAPAPADVHMYGDYSSSLFARAWTNAYLATAGGSTTVTGNVSLQGGARAHVGARTGATTTITGNVTLNSQNFAVTTRQSGGQTVFDRQGGNSLIYAETNGTLSIGGSVTLIADASSAQGLNVGTGPLRSTTTAGLAQISSTGGTIRIGGNTTLSAGAFLFGNTQNPDQLQASDLRAGMAGISAQSGGSITLNGASNLLSANAAASARNSVGSLIGGSTYFNVTTGTLQASGNVALNANAVDTGVAGGRNAVAGRSDVFAGQGTVSVGGTLLLNANAEGGGSDAGAGGTARGGSSIVNASTGGTVTVTGQAQLNATARGGAANGGGFGGAATGGDAMVFATGTVNLGGLLAFAFANGGTNNATTVFGGSGGDAVGGRAFAQAGTGTLTINGATALAADGTGGSSTGAGGNGGDGTGGLARLEVLAAAGRVVVNGNVSANASGIGGAGLGGTSAGGDGFGGVQGSNFFNGAYLFAGAGSLTVNGTATLVADGRGGAGGDAGDGIGGFGSATSYDGALVVTGLTSGSVSGIGGNSNGSNPGEEGGHGGSGEGGEFFINAQANTGSTGSVRLADVAIQARGQGGAGSAGIGGAGGDGGDGLGGFIQSYGSASSLGVTLGNVTFDASGLGGTAGAGGVGAQGQAGFAGGFGGDGIGGTTNIGTQSGIDRPANTGFHTFGSAVLTASGTGGLGGAGGAGGTGAVGGRGGAGGLGQGGGTVLLVRGTPVTGGALTMTARGVGGLGGVGGTGTTGGAAGAAGDGEGGGAVIVASNRFERTERGRATIGAVSMDTSGVGGTPVAGIGDIDVSGADVTLASLTYTSAGASPTGGNPPASIPGFDVGVANGTLAVTGALRLTVPGTFNLAGALSAESVSVAARGVNLGSNAVLGGAGTQSITLTNLGAGSVIIGGEEEADQVWSLSNAEIGRLRANQIQVGSSEGGQGAVTVRNLTLTGSGGAGAGNLVGSNAEFRIAGGVVRVEGAITLRDAATTDTLSLVGSQRVEVVTDRNGSITLTGPATGDIRPLGGVLALNAPVIGVGTDTLLTQLAANPRFEGRNALLSAAPTTATPAGFVQANRLILTTTNVAAIQNSGTATAFGGFTAGTGGLLVRAPDGTQAGSAPAQVVVYGRVQRPGGGFFESNDIGSGAAFASGQSGLFDRASTVNGCAVGVSCGSGPAEIVAAVTALEEVLAEAEEDAELVEVPTIDVVQVVDQRELVVQTDVTEPVSGAGNPGLWDIDAEDAGSRPARQTP